MENPEEIYVIPQKIIHQKNRELTLKTKPMVEELIAFLKEKNLSYAEANKLLDLTRIELEFQHSSAKI